MIMNILCSDLTFFRCHYSTMVLHWNFIAYFWVHFYSLCENLTPVDNLRYMSLCKPDCDSWFEVNDPFSVGCNFERSTASVQQLNWIAVCHRPRKNRNHLGHWLRCELVTSQFGAPLKFNRKLRKTRPRFHLFRLHNAYIHLTPETNHQSDILPVSHVFPHPACCSKPELSSRDAGRLQQHGVNWMHARGCVEKVFHKQTCDHTHKR